MTVKIAMLVLALLILAGAVRKWRRPPTVGGARARPIEAARKCVRCDAYVVDPASCARADCPLR